jgi:hypothetical protein
MLPTVLWLVLLPAAAATCRLWFLGLRVLVTIGLLWVFRWGAGGGEQNVIGTADDVRLLGEQCRVV